MLSRWRPLFVVAVLLAGVGLSVPSFLLHSLTARADFRALTEQKAGEFLQAKVHIRDIRVGLMNRVDLTGLVIDPEKAASIPYEVQVEKIIFKYDLFQLLTRSLHTPAAIIFNEPSVVLKQAKFPYELFKNLDSGSSRSHVSSLELRGGQIRIPVETLQSDLILKKIQGRFYSLGQGKIKVDFQAVADGFLRGRLTVRGEIDTWKEKHRLQLEFKKVRFTKKVAVPLEAMQGVIQWENDRIDFNGFKTKIRGWECLLTGLVREAGTAPKVVLKVTAKNQDKTYESRFEADFAASVFQADLKIPDERDMHLEGGLRRERSRLLFDRVILNREYQGKGEVDFFSGDASFDLEKESQRIGVRSNLKRLQWDLHLQLDHFDFGGLDLVTSAAIHLKAVSFLGEKRFTKMAGDFQTEYFILEHTPFDDFQGTFEWDSSGIKNLSGRWGRAFQMNGSVGFKPFSTKLYLFVRGFDLAGVHEFAAKPLPRRLGGIVEGKLKVAGPLRKPEISGSFSIKDGRLGRLEYDRALILFEGTAPYLPIKESKILRGRTKLFLTGALDLSLPNIFHGIEIQTADKLVLWKGLEVNASREEGDLEIAAKLSPFPTLGLKAGLTSGEYAPGAGDPDQIDDEKYIAAGPKFKF